MLGLASQGGELLLSRAMGNRACASTQVIRLRVQVRASVKRSLLSVPAAWLAAQLHFWLSGQVLTGLALLLPTQTLKARRDLSPQSLCCGLAAPKTPCPLLRVFLLPITYESIMAPPIPYSQHL